MGYKYQNRLDEENERQYWSRYPRWYRVLFRILVAVFFVVFVAVTLYGTFGWLLAMIF